MIPNRVFTWLALILIVYVLVANRGNIVNQQPVVNVAEQGKKVEVKPPQTGAQQQALPEIKNSLVYEKELEKQLEEAKNKLPEAPNPKEQEELFNQIAKLKELAEHSKGLVPVSDAENAKRKPTTMFSRENISITDFSVNAKKRSGMLVEDMIKGEGPAIFCGNTVDIHYKLSNPEGKELYSSRTKDVPETVTVGGGQIIKGLENGLIGMKKGGVRKITIPASYAFDDAKFKGKGPASTKIIAEVELKDIKEPFKNSSKMPLRIYDDTTPFYSGVLEVVCGQKVSLNYALWSLDGNLIATSIADEKFEKNPGKSKLKSDVSLPLNFRLGDGKVPLAVEASVSGNEETGSLRINGKRTLVVPPDYMKTLSGKPAGANVFDGAKIPKGQTTILEVELIKVEGEELPKINF